MKIHVGRAMIVQLVWDAAPQLQKRVLSAEYIQGYKTGLTQHGRRVAAKHLRINLAEYEAALRVVSRKIMIAFEAKADSEVAA